MEKYQIVKKEIAYVNLQEIQNIIYGTKRHQVYNNMFYGCDLEIYVYMVQCR